ncbi:hypothetical protein [Azospirillum sp. B510]|uniref:hypothetical protein n=1 Tax=Azospirillum sp. (strain B510) TaxID=137722 RepID=UPI00130545BD|nr:hypothetical protein [Azospirillum sp. B510]
MTTTRRFFMDEFKRGHVEHPMHRHGYGLRAQRPRAFRVRTSDSNHALPIA